MALRNTNQNNVTGCSQLISVTHATWEHQQVTHPVTQCDLTWSLVSKGLPYLHCVIHVTWEAVFQLQHITHLLHNVS